MKQEKKSNKSNRVRKRIQDIPLEEETVGAEEVADIKFSGNVVDDTIVHKKKPQKRKKKKPTIDPNVVDFKTNVKDDTIEKKPQKKKESKIKEKKSSSLRRLLSKKKKSSDNQIDEEPETWIIKSNLLNFEAIKRRITHRKNRDFLLKVLIILFIIISISIVTSRYLTNTEFRENVDTNFGKKVDKESIVTIDTDSNNIIAYSSFIGILNKSGLTIYNGSGKEEKVLDVSIASPKYSTKKKYLALAEDKGNKIYLINDSVILWKKEIEGEIANIDVNENGYVSVIVKNTSSKSMIMLFDRDGKELCEYYLASTYAISTSVSPNNKYLAIGEIDYSGTIVKSRVEILSIDEAIEGAKDPIINKYESEPSEVVNNVNYIDNENAICMFNNYIQKVRSNDNSRVADFSNNTYFYDVGLNNSIATIEKQDSEMFSFEYQLRITQPNTKSEKLYILDSNIPKSMKCNGNYVVVNYGTKIQIINLSGRLEKEYESNTEIKDIIVGNSIVGVVLKNKVEIIKI